MKKKEVKRREIWWCDFGEGVGHEHQGLRPCVVVSNGMSNLNSDIVTVVPLTTKHTHLLPCHVELHREDCAGLRKPSVALCEQVRTVDVERLKNCVGYVKSAPMRAVSDCLKEQLGM